MAAARAGGHVTRRAGWSLALPALALTLAVLAGGLSAVLAESLGMAPLVGEPRLTADGWRAALPSLRDGLIVTLAVAAASTALAVVGGVALAVLVLRSGLGGRVVAGLAAATLPIPHLVGASAMALLLADSGLLARLVGGDPGGVPGAGRWAVVGRRRRGVRVEGVGLRGRRRAGGRRRRGA